MRLPQHLVPYLSTTPQPIALSLGRVARGSSRPEGLEACLKAAEMLTRYLAVISLASAAATKPPDQDLPVVEGFEGNLAFGTFELAIRQAIAVSWEHPLREQLRAAMRSTKKQQAVTGVRLERFVQLRNELGHAITHVDELRAGSLFEQFDPIGALIECIEDLGPVLRCPPLAVVRQENRRYRLTARVLFFVGEGDPIPNDIDLRTPVFDWELAYLCTAAGLLPLSPGLALMPRPDGRRGIYLIDGIQEGSIRYKSAFDNDVVVVPGVGQELSRWLGGFDAATPTGGGPLLEPVTCADGRSLFGFLRNETPPAGEADVAKARRCWRGSKRFQLRGSDQQRRRWRSFSRHQVRDAPTGLPPGAVHARSSRRPRRHRTGARRRSTTARTGTASDVAARCVRQRWRGHDVFRGSSRADCGRGP